MREDVGVSEATEVIVFEPRPGSAAANPLGAVVEISASAVFALFAVAEQTVNSTVSTVANSALVNSALDKVVPYAVNAVIGRMNLTEIVLDRVDIDEIVAQADLEKIIDRLPLIDLANYIIDEIDLAQIIRQSTGGIATDAMNTTRMQAIDADDLVQKVVDTIMLRRKARKTTAPGEIAAEYSGEPT
jgi:hypothetical protein